jgi:hypothetical protein
MRQLHRTNNIFYRLSFPTYWEFCPSFGRIFLLKPKHYIAHEKTVRNEEDNGRKARKNGRAEET